MNHLAFTSGDYNIEAENNCASLLSNFNSNYIYDVLNFALSVKDIPSIQERPNIVAASELTFKQLYEEYPADRDNIFEVRRETFKEILSKLGYFYKATFADPGEELWYRFTKDIYYFLACGYVRCLIKFMASHIYANRKELVQIVNPAEAKKSKDSATTYYKKRFSNDEDLALIIANIDVVIDVILGQDIELIDILKYIFIDENWAILLANSFQFEVPFYDFYKETMKGLNRPTIVSNIMLQLQSHYSMSNTPVDNISDIGD
jgi:hypothetical protein